MPTADALSQLQVLVKAGSLLKLGVPGKGIEGASGMVRRTVLLGKINLAVRELRKEVLGGTVKSKFNKSAI